MDIYNLQEKQNINCYREGEDFEAENLKDAKNKASQMQCFQGTILDLTLYGQTVAYTDENGKWTDV